MKFVDGVKLYNGLVYSTDINYLDPTRVCLMCHDYTLKPPHCKTCDKKLTPEQQKKLTEYGFTIIDNKCCISYLFK
jgi:uncharacterized paraquat-inducible protein A